MVTQKPSVSGTSTLLQPLQSWEELETPHECLSDAVLEQLTDSSSRYHVRDCHSNQEEVVKQTSMLKKTDGKAPAQPIIGDCGFCQKALSVGNAACWNRTTAKVSKTLSTLDVRTRDRLITCSHLARTSSPSRAGSRFCGAHKVQSGKEVYGHGSKGYNLYMYCDRSKRGSISCAQDVSVTRIQQQ